MVCWFLQQQEIVLILLLVFLIAISVLSKILELKSSRDSTRFLSHRGFLYLRTGQTEKALEDFRCLLGPLALSEATQLQQQQIHLPDEAQALIDDVSKLIQLQPLSAEAVFARAQLHRSLGFHDLALQDFDRALQLKPSFTQASFGKACSLQDQGKIPGLSSSHIKLHFLGFLVFGPLFSFFR